MTLAENLADLERHAGSSSGARRSRSRCSSPASARAIGCVYIAPSKRSGHDADVRRGCATHAELDDPLRRGVATWLADEWPFHSVYAPGLG
jgi:hypothetical protein